MNVGDLANGGSSGRSRVASDHNVLCGLDTQHDVLVKDALWDIASLLKRVGYFVIALCGESQAIARSIDNFIVRLDE